MTEYWKEQTKAQTRSSARRGEDEYIATETGGRMRISLMRVAKTAGVEAPSHCGSGLARLGFATPRRRLDLEAAQAGTRILSHSNKGDQLVTISQ